MDHATFDTHKHPVDKGETMPIAELPLPTDEEQGLFQLLNRNGWCVEQERVDADWARRHWH